jgi:type II secretion system protein G
VGDVLIDPEEKSLQGTWRVESNSMEAMFERSKVKTEIENMKTRAGPTLAWGGILALVLSKDQTVQITGQCILSLAESEGVAGPRATDDIAYYATNPQSQPKAIDLFEPHAWTVSANAIYRLDGERLTLCLMKADGVRRPASFDVPPDQNTARIVLRRVPDVGKTPAGKTVAGAGPAQTPPRPSLAEIEQVRHQIDAFNKALAQRRLEWGDYPSNDEGLKALLQRAQTRDGRLLGGTWIEAVPPDPWGHAYQYQYPSSHGKGTPDIWSNGPDGKPIGSWEQ